MALLHEVDKAGSDIDVYLRSLDGLMEKKMQQIKDVRKKLLAFSNHLKMEVNLNKLY